MIVVTGHLVVDPAERDRVLALSLSSVQEARRNPACLDFAVSPDPVDPERVNVAERWESRAALQAFRGAGPAGELASLIRDARVEEHEVSGAAPGVGAEQSIRDLVQARADAVRVKDLDAIAETLADDVESFNVLPPHRIIGRGAVLEGTRGWFDGYPGTIGYEVHDLQASADEEVGFCAYLYRVTGTLAGGDDVDMWVRATLGCERRDGRWVVTHDHGSVPWDPQTGQGVLTVG